MVPTSLQERARKAVALVSGSSQRRWRPSLLALTALAATVAAVANAVALAAPPPAGEVPTRLGTSIAQSMRDRDRTAAERNRALDLREQAQRAAEQRLRNDLQASQPASADVPPGTPPGAPVANPQETVFDDLARIYQTMKPARAAPIFERLAMDVQVQVAKRMRERSTALIMASMSPDAAVELSMALAGRQVVKAPPPRPVSVRPVAVRPAPQGRAPQRSAQGSARPPVRAPAQAPVRATAAAVASAGEVASAK